MSKKQDRLIAEQQNYLDMVTAIEPYRRITVSDRANAQIELLSLRAQAAQAEALQAERDSFAELNDAVHRAVNEMCGTDTSTIEAVNAIVLRCKALQASVNDARDVLERVREFMLIDEVGRAVTAESFGLGLRGGAITADVINWLTKYAHAPAQPEQEQAG